MPNRDGTGPLGQGSGTGRKLGACSAQTNSQVCGRRGSGRSQNCRFNAANFSQADLEEQEKFLEEKLLFIRQLKNNSPQ
ncbi:MAG TPA: DUF5320 domain-containing protein [Candidatus Gracilibacteria bacterium]|nr:DUF5320 domain-containing protein [Candidatus Gracilibacteria bacterium]